MGRLRLSTAQPIPSGHAYNPNYVCNASVPSLPDPQTRPRAFSGERTNNQSQCQYTIVGLNRQGKAFDTFYAVGNSGQPPA